MRKIFEIFVNRIAKHGPRMAAARIISIFWKYSKSEVSLQVTSDGLFHVGNFDKSGGLYIYRSSRIPLYSRGLSTRLKQLEKDYWLSDVVATGALNKNDIGIDIGANVGEVSQLLHSVIGISQILAFEPDPHEFRCLQRNLPSSDNLFNIALWSEIESKDFFLSNETGDSSLFAPNLDSPSIKIETTTLDACLESLQYSRIGIIKLEAEGAEPEIVKGGSMVFSKTVFVTADLGPERGTEQKETFTQVFALLSDLGFELIRSRTEGRRVYLFRNLEFV
jgi:FkbM family methyltransferase